MISSLIKIIITLTYGVPLMGASLFEIESLAPKNEIRLSLVSSERIVRPNELNSQLLSEIYKESKSEGAILSAGTERGFDALGKLKNSSHLILVSSNPEDITFNQINLLLLTISRSRLDYLSLRYDATVDELVKRTSVLEQRNTISKSAFQNWISEVRAGLGFFGELSGAPSTGLANYVYEKAGSSSDRDYRTNYLFNDENFTKVQQHAKSSHILVLFGDLSDWKQVRFLSTLLFQAQITLKLIDLDHFWLDRYMGLMKLLAFQAQIRPVINQDTIVILTEPLRNGFWNYLGMRFVMFANVLNEAELGDREIFRKYFIAMKAQRQRVSFLDMIEARIIVNSCRRVL